jgi:hypothetical protein
MGQRGAGCLSLGWQRLREGELVTTVCQHGMVPHRRANRFTGQLKLS